jgi:CheY-like chemotaxis protein
MKTILVVEDDEPLAYSIAKRLTMAGYAVTTVTSSMAALDFLDSTVHGGAAPLIATLQLRHYRAKAGRAPSLLIKRPVKAYANLKICAKDEGFP